MPRATFFAFISLINLLECYAADAENQDPAISAGGIAALVILVVFAAVLLGSCIYQSRKSASQDEPQHRILRCGGCRRAFRVPAAVEGVDFMCSRCVTEGRRRMSVVLEEERLARFARMREAANKSIKLERVTSTFFKIASRRSKSGVPVTPETPDSPDRADGAVGPVLTHQKTGQSLPGGTECKICFDDESCIVLIPCGHSGICEGCAKDLVTLTKECYICRSEIELIAKIKKPKTGAGQSATALHNHPQRTSSDLFANELSAWYVAPDSLHHLASRRNTCEDSTTSITRRHTLENLDQHAVSSPVLVPSRRSTLAEFHPHPTEPIVEEDVQTSV